MCGISGIIKKEKSVDIGLLHRMQDAIAHRGPDMHEIFQYQNIAFAHRRLSIVDLSETGRQPMHDVSGNYTIIFNGEIYNHQYIRKELIQKGYRFKGTSDTETLLYGFIEYGKNIVHKLNGIFAFAILDKTKNEVFISRDHLGVKPLYIYQKDDIIIFSSEIKAICCYDKMDKTLNYPSLTNYITFLWSPGTDTPFKYVNKILPGHSLTVQLQTLHVVNEKYYEVPFEGKVFDSISEKDLILQTEQKLFEAVERQMMSDVPVGFFVSGGIDSSLIAAIAQQIYPRKAIQAFTIDSGEMDMKEEGFSNDLNYAKTISKQFGFDLNIINAKVDILNDFDRMIWHLDEPQADSAPLSVYNISKAAQANGIKVLLGGAGGDDIFSGYRRHVALSIEKWLALIPRDITFFLKKYGDSLDYSSPFKRRFKKLVTDLEKSKSERMVGYYSWINSNITHNLFSPEIQPHITGYNPLSILSNLLKNIPQEKQALNQMLYLELKSFLVDHNLNYTDKLSMAAGVEARVPYLDLELVNFSTQIPVKYKLHGTQTKYILKKIAEKYIPHEIINRPKAGFGAPVRKWITNDMKGMIKERLSESKLKERGIFDSKAVWSLIHDNEAGKIDASYTIWSLLAIESWIEQFIDGKKLH